MRNNMRNKYGGYCYYCGGYVFPNEGHFERYNHHWRVIHFDCVFKQRREKQEKLEKDFKKALKNLDDKKNLEDNKNANSL